jgi:hypothetical protein
MLVSVFAVARHAECLAEKLGEPVGTLVLTSSVIGIEVMIIVATMSTGHGTMLERVFTTLIRDFENASTEEQERIVRIARGILPLSRRREGLWNNLVIVASSPRYELERIASPTHRGRFVQDCPGARTAAERIPVKAVARTAYQSPMVIYLSYAR